MSHPGPDHPEAIEAPAAAGSRLRWSLTLQALAGGGVLAAALLGTLVGLLLALDKVVAAWPDDLAGSGLWTALAGLCLWLGLCLLRWLWSPLPCPEGIGLDREGAPEFHGLLDRLRQGFGIRRPLAVCVTGEMNASIASRPGGLTLQVGLPLLLSVTPRQCDAILSHELGHLVLQRTGPGAWASHLRAWWFRVLDRIDEDPGLLGRGLARLLKAADRRYLADGLRLARAEEYEADALAAGAVGAAPLAEALSAMALKQHFLAQDFLPKIRAQVYHRQQPSMLPYRQMASAFLVGYDSRQALAALGEAAEEEESPTHPSIRSRMARLTADPWPLPGDAATAAEAYLGAAVPRLAAALDQEWWHQHGRDWQRHHREVQWARRRIVSLAERGGDQHPLRRLELADLVATYCPEYDPVEQYLELLAEEEVRPQAMLAVGSLLTEQGSIEGAGYLLALLDQDSEVGLAAATRLVQFAEATGREDLGRRAADRALALEALARDLLQEAAADAAGEGWSGPGLDPITKYKLTKRVAAHGDVRRAYLVRRRSATAPRWQVCLLLLRTELNDPAHLAAIGGEIQDLLQDRALVCALAIPAGSDWERTAAAAGRTRLHLRRKPARD